MKGSVKWLVFGVAVMLFGAACADDEDFYAEITSIRVSDGVATVAVSHDNAQGVFPSDATFAMQFCTYPDDECFLSDPIGDFDFRGGEETTGEFGWDAGFGEFVAQVVLIIDGKVKDFLGLSQLFTVAEGTPAAFDVDEAASDTTVGATTTTAATTTTSSTSTSTTSTTSTTVKAVAATSTTAAPTTTAMSTTTAAPTTTAAATTTTTAAPTTTAAATTTTTTTAAPTTMTTEATTTTTTAAPTTTTTEATTTTTTAAPTTTTTEATTTTTTTTVPNPLTLSLEWSGSNTTMCMPYDIFLDAYVGGYSGTPTISASVEGQTVSSYGGWDSYMEGFLLDDWPTLTSGTYTVTVTVSNDGFTKTATESVVYDCP